MGYADLSSPFFFFLRLSLSLLFYVILPQSDFTKENSLCMCFTQRLRLGKKTVIYLKLLSVSHSFSSVTHCVEMISSVRCGYVRRLQPLLARRWNSVESGAAAAKKKRALEELLVCPLTKKPME